MKKFFLLSLIVLFFSTAYSQIFTVDTLFYNGDTDNRINLVILGDGYASNEMAQFRGDAQLVASYFYGIEPFSTYRNFFNFFGIEVVSNESGVNHPGTASDEGGTSQPITTVDNYLKTTFDYGGTHRCVFSNQQNLVYSVVNTNVPYYDYINVIINTSYYGGCAGSVAYTTMEGSSPEIFVHEFGHMFGGLADEYEYGGSNCPAGGTSQQINVSQQTDTSLLVWKKWLTNAPIPTQVGTNCNKIGLYEGAHYCDSNWYRPKCDCRMRSLNQDYCEVCYEQFIYKISTKVNYIENHSPSNAVVNICNGSQQLFHVDVLNTTDSTVRVQWFLDSVLVTNNSANYNYNSTLHSTGFHQLKAVAYDTTLKAKKTLTSYNQTWNIYVLDAIVTSTDSLHFCEPDSATLKATRGVTYSYQWLRNNQVIPGETDSTISVKNSGNYSVIITSGSCNDTSAQVNVVANQQPSALVSLLGNDTICSGGSALLTTNLCASCSGHWKKNGIDIPGATNDSLTVNAAGLYSVGIVNSTTGCAALSPTQNIFLSSINAILSSSAMTICEDDSTLLTVQPSGMIYQWYRNHVLLPGLSNDSLTVLSSGNYFSNISDGVCIDTSNSVDVVVNPLPVVTFAGLPDSMCIYQSPVTLIGTPPGGNFSSTGISGNVFDPSVAGAGLHPVAYTFVDANGCSNESIDNVFVDFCSGIESIENDNSIRIYPNPTSGKIILESRSTNDNKISIVVFDLVVKFQRKILSDEILAGGKSKEIDCSDLSPGTFYLEISTEKKTYLSRLMIIK